MEDSTKLGEGSGGIRGLPTGCLVGPLVVAGIVIEEDSVEDLKELGVRDSKRLSPRRRHSIYSSILKLSNRVHTLHIGPYEIDTVVRTGNKYRKLNYLEALYFAKVIDHLGARHVTVDACDSSPERFRSTIMQNLKSDCHVAAFHKADRDFPVVSAASIIAKVERDRVVQKLRKKHGDFGSGYPSDPATRTFFTDWMRKGEPLPDYVRKSWKTWARLRQGMAAPD